METMQRSYGWNYTATESEKLWLEKRMAQMSPKEKLQLSAALELEPVNKAGDLINLTFQLDCYELFYPAKDDRELGEYVVRYLEYGKERALAYINQAKLGEYFRTRQEPGTFTGGAYVFPNGLIGTPVYDGSNLADLKDDAYSLKIKLSSASNKEGVWLRLPDYAEVNCGQPDELKIALDTLGVSSLGECQALEVVSVLPNLTDLLKQYDSLEELVYSGSNLGYVLEEGGQGLPHFMERFQAVMEYEKCDRLDLALDISQNLHCYDFVPRIEDIVEYGRQAAIKDGLVQPGTLSAECFDFEFYGKQKIREAGMIMTEFGYVGRNAKSFYYEYSQKENGFKLTI
ncbi:hypothetical protein [Desulfitobacterium hafniense]|nr:hypothetical protein [Desulfitobacterium hafniense]